MNKHHLILFFLLAASQIAFSQQSISLAGQWRMQLDSLDKGTPTFNDAMELPGTTDQAGKGVKNQLKPALTKPQLSHLTRKISYIGVAWYERDIEIPANWKGQEVELELERVLWKSEVWVNGVKVEGKGESLIAPHHYLLGKYLNPGKKNTIRLKIDNRKQYDISVDDMAHAYTDHTQIKWNGVLGNIKLTALHKQQIQQIKTYPTLHSVDVKCEINATSNKAVDFIAEIVDLRDNSVVDSRKQKVKLIKGNNGIAFNFGKLDKVESWSEFNPVLYAVRIKLGDQQASTEFGFREIAAEGKTMTINGNPLFLRGTLDCCIFPLTGTPPMERAGWEKWLGTLKQWGINHVRFHSWCPPKAAFEVADRLGLYLQVELPLWQTTINKESSYIDYLRNEGIRIFNEYGNHPSFVMFSLGNELQQDFDVLGKLLADLRQNDHRQLYTTSTFTFEQGHGDRPEPADEFFVTQWTKDGWVRGQGVFNAESPSFNRNYEQAVAAVQVPLVTHEIGQYSVYPSMTEINKYTGVLEPLNLMAIKEDLQKKGLVNKAQQYLNASGRLAVILYKEEIERALKTDGISGFQLLSLSDFSGQGTALVGILDAFGHSKGFATAQEFATFNAPVVPLLQFPKACYTSNETFSAQIDVANYSGKELINTAITYTIKENGTTLHEATMVVKNTPLKQGYNKAVGAFSYDLKAIIKPVKLTVSIEMKGTPYHNAWSIWVYPNNGAIDMGSVNYTRSWNVACKLLEKGATVLFNPDYKTINGIEGKFVPVFWSPVHFPKQAGTMGVLCNPQHPALSQFPTEYHSNWQWWDLNIHSTTMIVDSIAGGSPIVEMIDNFANNRRLALIFEGSVGKGKLLISSIDLSENLDNRPAAKALLRSLVGYMNSQGFNPKPILNHEAIKSMITEYANAKGQQGKATDIY